MNIAINIISSFFTAHLSALSCGFWPSIYIRESDFTFNVCFKGTYNMILPVSGAGLMGRGKALN